MIQRYPPTTRPIITEPQIHPKSLLLLKTKIVKVARKLAAEPKIISIGSIAPKAIIPPATFPTKHPIVAPPIIGHPSKAASGRRLSATLSWIGPNDIGARKTSNTA